MSRNASLNRSRSQTRGVTRFEVALAAGAIALGTLAVSWWAHSKGGSDAAARATDTARALLEATSEWKREHEVRGCPSVTQLIRDARLDGRAPTDDPWGGRYRITCRGEQVQVRSAGGDGRFQTSDDISLQGHWKS